MPDPTTALYVRLPHPEFDKLDRAAEALSTNKKTLVTTLVSHYVDPDTRGGPATALRVPALRRRARGASRSTLPERGHGGRPPRVHAGARARRAHARRRPPTCCRSTEAEVVALAEAGELPGRRIGEHWRFSRPALIAWLAAAPDADDAVRSGAGTLRAGCRRPGS